MLFWRKLQFQQSHFPPFRRVAANFGGNLAAEEEEEAEEEGEEEEEEVEKERERNLIEEKDEI